jgi:hypothetical protein
MVSSANKSKSALLHTYGTAAEDSYIDAIENNGQIIILQNAIESNKSIYKLSYLKEDFFIQKEIALNVPTGLIPKYIIKADLGNISVLLQKASGNLFIMDQFEKSIELLELNGTQSFTLKGFENNENNDFFIIGQQENKATVLKADQFGNMIWSQSYTGFDSFDDIKINSNNEIVVLGNEVEDGVSNVAMLKLSESGGLIWSSTYEMFGSDIGNTFAFDMNQDMIIGGSTNSLSAGSDMNLFAMKVNNEGQMVWVKDYGHANDRVNMADAVSDIKILDENRIILTGYTMTYGGGMRDVSFTTIDGHGNWMSASTTFGAENDDETNKIIVLGNKIVAIGSTQSMGHGNTDVLLVELDTLFGGQPSILVTDDFVASTSTTGMVSSQSSIVVDVFPNPTKDILYIKLQKDYLGGNLKIMDVTGRMIYSQNISSNNVRYNMESLASSTYYLTIEKDEEVLYFEKIIKN